MRIKYRQSKRGRISTISSIFPAPNAVLPTPRGDYFTANWRVGHGGYRGGRRRRKDNRSGHTLHRKSMPRLERRDPNGSYHIRRRGFSPRGDERTRPAALFHIR
ncbi:hypothetical protein PUN28_004457 [Cardiocondyla obscurior]|uniref:Ribosomal protein L2 n=1 Tax=Cardiocondyla obscurior TaxID=286306 RepID=A0AAW2GCK2_9HYME